MSARYVPEGRAIEAVAPRPGALVAIAEGVRARRRNRARVAVAVAVALVAAAPLMLARRDSTVGLEPLRPAPSSAAAPSRASAAGDFAGGAGVGGAGSVATNGAASPGGAPIACPCPTAAAASADPTRPAAPTGTLTLTGSRTAYGTVRIDRTTTVDLAGVSADYLGDYAGLAIGDGEVLYVRGMDDPVGGAPAYRSGGSVTLRPGVYRVYLFAPAGSETTVRVPWSGQPSATVRPDVAVDAHYADPQRTVANDGSGLGNSIDAATATSVTIVAATLSPAATGVALTGCVHLPAEKCAAPRVIAHAIGSSVHLGDRIPGGPAGLQYAVAVRGDTGAAPGLLQLVMFRYDRA